MATRDRAEVRLYADDGEIDDDRAGDARARRRQRRRASRAGAARRAASDAAAYHFGAAPVKVVSAWRRRASRHGTGEAIDFKLRASAPGSSRPTSGSFRGRASAFTRTRAPSSFTSTCREQSSLDDASPRREVARSPDPRSRSRQARRRVDPRGRPPDLSRRARSHPENRQDAGKTPGTPRRHDQVRADPRDLRLRIPSRPGVFGVFWGPGGLIAGHGSSAGGGCLEGAVAVHRRDGSALPIASSATPLASVAESLGDRATSRSRCGAEESAHGFVGTSGRERGNVGCVSNPASDGPREGSSRGPTSVAWVAELGSFPGEPGSRGTRAPRTRGPAS